MQDSISTSNGSVTITIADKLTFEDHDNFRSLLKVIESEENNSCTINLKDLNTIDSAGLGMLMIAFEAAEKTGTSFQIHQPDGQVKRLLEISEFDKVMTIVS